MENTIFTQISLVIAITAVVAIVMRLLKQPLIVGYILTGIIVGPGFLHLVKAQEAFHSFSDLGIALLLFIIGLGLNMGVIRSLGKVSLLTAGTILLLVGSAGHAASLLMGFNHTTGILIGISLFFSSTIIILKMLSDQKETSRLFGQIAIGVIIMDDIVATIALVVVAAMGSHTEFTALTIPFMAMKVVGLGLLLYVLGAKIMPKVSYLFAKSQELLFLFSIAWGLSVATLFEIAGFSVEVGALLAGISLAGLPYAAEMAAKLKPLRDFFIVIFFITLGEAFTFNSLAQSLVPALILSLVVMIGKPIFVMGSLGLQGYTKFTSFKAAIHLSQISEFSIILIIFAASVGVVNTSIVPIITLVALITIGISTYLMKYSDRLYHKFERQLSLFERKNPHEKKQREAYYPIILIGYHKGGYEFVKVFREMRQRYLVIDYDPEVIDHLDDRGIRHAYGDATDEEFLVEINAARASLIVSTLEDVHVNRLVLAYLRRHNPKASFICHAKTYKDASELYEHGASYVSIPHYIGSERVSSFIKKHGISHDSLNKYRNRHLITIGRKALHSL
jgi:Kef-type K+ transport system membrane component KefB/voltage-gated potassium channel Kch